MLSQLCICVAWSCVCMYTPEELAHPRLQPHDGIVGWGAQVEPAVVESEVLPQPRERSIRVLSRSHHHTQHITPRVVQRSALRRVSTVSCHKGHRN